MKEPYNAIISVAGIMLVESLFMAALAVAFAFSYALLR